ncbi:hypothetical protein LZG04_31135 [Saccharothrix sp. S26]|uniref:hypothetical protein n=1 Tax=Saccharothrix sp. S26 TaxID=2907215 RepID=UPI001F3AB59E|nr:hypothetical protein [Saccharothrix sp. S26]MCE6999227.1 hypothetical protein [Saccharothrix sp. S26]
MKGFAVLGTVLVCVLAPIAMVYGLMAFTPTGSCDYSVSGVCSYGRLPMIVASGGTALVWAVSVVLTWAGTRGRPRVYVPYAALVVIVLLLVVAGRVAG